jgi:hypothetical protein
MLAEYKIKPSKTIALSGKRGSNVPTTTLGSMSQTDKSGLGEIRGSTPMASQGVEPEWGVEEKLVFRERKTYGDIVM